MDSKLPALLVLALAAALLFGCTSQAENGKPAELGATDTNALAATGTEGQIVISFTIKNGDELLFQKASEFPKGTNAFDAMKQMFEVEYKEFAFGAMVSSINGVSSGTDKYWALYTDGNYAMQGISSYVLGKDSSFEWRLEEISQAKV